MTVGTVEIMIAFLVLLQRASGEKSSRKVSIYTQYSNSCTVFGWVAFDNKYRTLTLNCGSLSIVFAKAPVVIMDVFIRKEPCSNKITLLLILGDEISTLRSLGFGRCYNWFIYIYTCNVGWRFTKA